MKKNLFYIYNYQKLNEKDTFNETPDKIVGKKKKKKKKDKK